MPIRRRSTPRPALRHVSFLETMATTAPDDPRHLAATATFLVLRLFDDRMRFGPRVCSADAPALAAARDAIGRIDRDVELHDVLAATTEALCGLRDDDLPAALSPLFTLGALLGAREQRGQAGDVYSTVARHADASTERDLAYESQMRAGDCLLRAGDRDSAARAFAEALRLALRDRDRLRVLHARLGRAKVIWARGDLEAADAAIRALVADAEEARSPAVASRFLHERAMLAWVRGECELAVRCAVRAFDLAPYGQDRDAILTALACYLDALDEPDAAQVARGAIAVHRLAMTRPVRRSAESDRATAIELAREIARTLGARGSEALQA